MNPTLFLRRVADTINGIVYSRKILGGPGPYFYIFLIYPQSDQDGSQAIR